MKTDVTRWSSNQLEGVMICPECQNEIPEGSKFCPECGTKIDLTCPGCGKSIPPGSKYCLECGYSLYPPASPEEIPKIDYQHPQSYTPKHLAEKILTTRSAIEGERKIVTVMFADVTGFTAISEKLDPEDVHAVMDGCFKILMDEIHRYEGTINQFTGDGVMALFGAPIAHEDHAQRACYAGLAIQHALTPYSQKLKENYGIDFKMRIGLNSGAVVVGTIGDDLRMDYTAQGDTANLASRMESSAEPGSVLATENTYRLSKAFFAFNPPESLRLKGKFEAVNAHKLIGTTGVKTRIAASTARGLTRFVGRNHELETLNEAFARVQTGEGQVAGLVGEAGVGKSRLLLEFRRALPRGESTYLEGRCLHYGGVIPYLPILDVLRFFFGVKEGEHEPVIKQKLGDRIRALGSDLMHVIPAFQDLLSLTVEDAVFAGLEPKQKREMTFEAIRDLLIRGSQERPLILAVEDLHWIDRTTEEFLNYMIGWLPRTRILLLLMYRPEYTHPWSGKSYYRLINMGQLSSGNSAELVAAILEGGDVAPELRDLILGRASGNPLFMEELTHTLVENGSIQKKKNRFVLTRNLSSIDVPDTIQGIIAARMDRLAEGPKKIMQLASVIGREFAFRILESISDIQADLKSALTNLQGLEFIYEKSLFPELEYIFRHALVQEVAYNSLLITRRKEIHEKIGRAIEHLYPDRLDEFCEILAFHYVTSGNTEKAYAYLKRSAKKAIRNNSLQECVRFFNEAMGILSQLPPTEENKREQIELVLSFQMPVRRIGYSDDYLFMLEKVEKLAEEVSDNKGRLQIQSIMGIYYILKGNDPELGWKYLEGCAEHHEIVQDTESMISTGCDLCMSCIVSGEWQRIIHIAPGIIGLIESCRKKGNFFGTSRYPWVLAMLGLSMAGSGDMENGLHFLERALTSAQKSNHSGKMGIVEWSYGSMLALKGDGEKAVEHLQNAVKYLEESQSVLMLGVAWAFLGFATCLSGKPDTGVEMTEKGLKIHSDLKIPWWISYCHWFCSYAQFGMGKLQEAHKHAALALQFSMVNNERQVQGLSNVWIGRLAVKIDPMEIAGAEQQILKGIALLEELKNKTHYSLGYLWLGEAYTEAGRHEAALKTLKKTETLLREMGMDYWLGKAQEAQAKLL
jgi:class 3 adenylate cyclase/tetratricopeptide (TPR) repeat protein